VVALTTESILQVYNIDNYEGEHVLTLNNIFGKHKISYFEISPTDDKLYCGTQSLIRVFNKNILILGKSNKKIKNIPM